LFVYHISGGEAGLKIVIEESESAEETEIHIKCARIDEELEKIIAAVELQNGEKIIISRQYMQNIKAKLGL